MRLAGLGYGIRVGWVGSGIRFAGLVVARGRADITI